MYVTAQTGGNHHQPDQPDFGGYVERPDTEESDDIARLTFPVGAHNRPERRHQIGQQAGQDHKPNGQGPHHPGGNVGGGSALRSRCCSSHIFPPRGNWALLYKAGKVRARLGNAAFIPGNLSLL